MLRKRRPNLRYLELLREKRKKRKYSRDRLMSLRLRLR